MTELKKHGIDSEVYTIEKTKLEKIDKRVKEKIEKVISISNSIGCAIGVVGGFVRDILLGNPSQDVDFTVFEGDINKLTEKIAEELDGKVGKMSNQTLTSQVRFKDGMVFEFNATRKEEYEYPSRIPKVEKANIVEDLNRRDFTINAFIMFDDKYIDIFNGTEDLENKLIRTTREPNVVFKEDYLRMIRAIRFASKLDFEIDQQVKEGIKANIENITQVPHERILSELKIALNSNPVKTFNLMTNLDILLVLFPEIPKLPYNQDVYFVTNSWEAIEKKLQYLQDAKVRNSNLFFAVIFSELQIEDAIFYDDNKIDLLKVEEIKSILRSFTFSNKEINEIILYSKHKKSIVRMHDFQSSNMEIRLFLRSVDPYFENLILLTESENSIRKFKLNLDSFIDKIRNINRDKSLVHVVPKLNGNEIEEIFGFKEKDIGEIKLILTVAIMKEEIPNTREACIEYIRKNLVK
ncbi:MAG: CCA tRNA nucleotidyltransferase [Candidatus Heimdallarchaeaceae archaeon]